MLLPGGDVDVDCGGGDGDDIYLHHHRHHPQSNVSKHLFCLFFDSNRNIHGLNVWNHHNSYALGDDCDDDDDGADGDDGDGDVAVDVDHSYYPFHFYTIPHLDRKQSFPS